MPLERGVGILGRNREKKLCSGRRKDKTNFGSKLK